MARHNVSDYGATGDGIADDAAAIQTAIDTAKDGDVIYFPLGIWRIGSSIELPETAVVFQPDTSSNADSPDGDNGPA